jgi:hypothetical protein
MQKGEKK